MSVGTKYKNSLEAVRKAGELSQYLHPDYIYYKPDWDMIRDALQGERRVKEQGSLYLPGLDTNFGTEYETYKERASFVNMLSRTVIGMVGTVFRRTIKVENVKKEDIENVTLDGLDLNLYAKKLALEVASVGRVGVLVDMPVSSGTPYLTAYIAENILSWRTEVINGREVLNYVLLREIVDNSQVLDGETISTIDGRANTNALRAKYRVLLLENGVYKQRVYDIGSNTTNPTFATESFEEIIPLRTGVPLDFIPMVIIGPLSPTPEIQKSPVYDIVTLNMAHYRTSAQLEHGRFNTALPVYYVPVSSPGDQVEYVIGPSVVWEVAADSRPGILEYFGTGLKALTDGLVEKEEHIAQLGGRIMGIRPQATSESDNIFKLKTANEMSILLNITESMSRALTDILRWYLDWQRKPIAGVRVRLNQDFKQSTVAARELRALALLYQEGILPLEEVFRALQDAEYIDDETTIEDFRSRLEDTDASFPNQADVEAMSDGYANATDRMKDNMSKRQQSLEKMQSQADREHERLQEARRVDQQKNVEQQMFKQGGDTSRFESQKPPAGKPPVKPPVKPTG